MNSVNPTPNQERGCGICGNVPGETHCSCGEEFCATCFQNHTRRNPTHRRAGSSIAERFWSWAVGHWASLTNEATRREQFQKDEGAKWFGLAVEKSGSDRIAWIVETPRFSNLVEDSVHYLDGSPSRQFPSIVSFVGDTGAGKSTLIRSLISNSKQESELDGLEAPVPGSDSGSASCIPTTGEVNLYSDPETFGTQSPRFYADCEGMLGAEPVAAQHQKSWNKCGRRYLIEEKDGKQIDRSTAVKTIYPKFLYIFSDAICMVTKNQRSWADTAVKLLEWSAIGARNTVNQYALPAAIIILNQPTVEDERWISEDQGATTEDFFNSIEQEIVENATLREMAQNNGDKTMKELLLRNFSSVHVHYVPLSGFRRLGTSETILRQISRLSQRIKDDCAHVQQARGEAWNRFDSKQLSILFDYAFKHLISESAEPFDFSKCRRQTALPESIDGHMAEFLKRSLGNGIERNFSYASSVISSSLIRHASKAEGTELVYFPFAIFDDKIKRICKRAVEDFLDNGLHCIYLHPASGERCANTKSGHARGHQSASGDYLDDGLFISGEFNSTNFLRAIEEKVTSLLREINSRDTDWQERRRFAIENHRQILQSASDSFFWGNFDQPRVHGMSSTLHPFIQVPRKPRGTVRTSTCFACLFGRPEYRLPCGHVLCSDCMRDFDQSDENEKYPGVVIHKKCVLCSSAEPSSQWPLKIQLNPEISGVRVLSLDGGGVRGIVELAVLRRLETCIGLGLPLGEFFDLIVGTSAGGMIALAMGVHKWNADKCIQKFRALCEGGFSVKWFTKTTGIGWLARWLRGSIYETGPLERALQKAYPSKGLFGLRRGTEGRLCNLARVAVTTTVNSECKLFANYNCGNSKYYLNSETNTWEAARCTSAAPMYFDSYRSADAGEECRDGGLRENNPVQIAVDESKVVWGEKVPFDLILSVGSGLAEKPQQAPWSGGIVPDWIYEMLQTLLATMNGEEAWKRFIRSAEHGVRARSHRLNVRFKGGQEPALDDTQQIDKMQREAEDYSFPASQLQFASLPLIEPPVVDGLQGIALRLRASLYFFHLKSISFSENRAAAIIKGSICCRLGPESDALRVLLEGTVSFRVKGRVVDIPQNAHQNPLRLEACFQQELSHDTEPLRIDAKFTSGNFVTISGFPSTLKVLQQIDAGVSSW